MILRATPTRRSPILNGNAQPKKPSKSINRFRDFAPSSAVGAAVGSLSDLVGVGGGIFLAPILHLSGWAYPKEIAATTTLFIAVNSVAGLLGQLIRGLPTEALGGELLPIGALMGAVVLGGQIGSRLTAKRLGPNVIRALTAGLIVIVGVRILIENV